MHATEAAVPDATLYHRVIEEARVLNFQTPVVAQPPLGFRGGVVLGDSEEDRRLRHTRGRRPVDSFDASAVVKDRLPGRYAYGGFVYHHFGHVMAETVHRILPSRRYDPERSFIFVNSRDWKSFELLPAHVQQIYQFLGLRPDTIKIISSSHLVENLLVSEAGSDLGGGPKEPYLDLLDTYTGPQLDRMFGSTRSGKKIYVSRSKLSINGGTLCGEKYIENALAAEGYEIFHPQEHPFAVQMDTYRKADLVIFLEGSACHGAELLGRDAINNCILLSRRGLVKFDRMLGPRVRTYSTFDLDYLGSIYASRDGRGLAGRSVSMAQWDALVEFFRNSGAARLSSTSKDAYLAAAERDFYRYLKGAEQSRSRQVGDELATKLVQQFEMMKAS